MSKSQQPSEELLQRLAEAEKLARYRPDGREQLDADAVVAALQTIVSDAYAGQVLLGHEEV